MREISRRERFAHGLVRVGSVLAAALLVLALSLPLLLPPLAVVVLLLWIL